MESFSQRVGEPANVVQCVLIRGVGLLHVLMSSAVSERRVTPVLLLLRLNIPVSGPVSFLPHPPPLATFSLLSILYSSPHSQEDGTVQRRAQRKEKMNVKTVEKVERGIGGGVGQPCMKLFFK